VTAQSRAALPPFAEVLPPLVAGALAAAPVVVFPFVATAVEAGAAALEAATVLLPAAAAAGAAPLAVTVK